MIDYLPFALIIPAGREIAWIFCETGEMAEKLAKDHNLDEYAVIRATDI